METLTLQKINKKIINLQKDMNFIKKVIAEDFELSEEAKRDLKEARDTPKEDFISQEEMEKEFL